MQNLVLQALFNKQNNVYIDELFFTFQSPKYVWGQQDTLKQKFYIISTRIRLFFNLLKELEPI